MPSPAIGVAYAVVIAVLIGGSVATTLLARRHPARDYTELRLRVRTWWLIVGALIAALSLGNVAVAVLFAAVSACALREYLVHAGPGDARLDGLAYLAVPIQYLLAYGALYLASIVFIIVHALLLAAASAVWVESGKRRQVARALSLGTLLAVFSLSHVLLLGAWPWGGRDGAAAGTGMIVFLLVVTQINDVAQYVFGKTFGRRLLAPQLSPSKTRAGLYGGVITAAMVAALLGPVLTGLGVVASAAAGMMLALAGVAGDLSVSGLKRRFGIKDMGRLLPGHGGMLDRVDSLIYAAPLFFGAMLVQDALY